MFKEVDLSKLDSVWTRARTDKAGTLAKSPDDAEWAAFVEDFCNSSPGEQMSPGVWDTWTHNFGHTYLDDNFDKFPERALARIDGVEPWKWVTESNVSYGVCDSVEQFLASAVFAYYSVRPEEFLATLVEIKKSDQPNRGGWRWHKWGSYIGQHDIQHEYLDDEEGIESVFCFSIYMRKPTVEALRAGERTGA